MSQSLIPFPLVYMHITNTKTQHPFRSLRLKKRFHRSVCSLCGTLVVNMCQKTSPMTTIDGQFLQRERMFFRLHQLIEHNRSMVCRCDTLSDIFCVAHWIQENMFEKYLCLEWKTVLALIWAINFQFWPIPPVNWSNRRGCWRSSNKTNRNAWMYGKLAICES